MATTQKTKTSESGTKKTAAAEQESAAAVKTETESKPIVAKEIDPAQYVSVRNGFRGKLVYISPRTGEEFVWDNYGDEQDMELRELKTAKAGAKAFFTENWFLLDDWVVRYLGVEGFYKHAKSPEEFDELFNMSPEDLRREIAEMTHGQKDAVVFRAKELIGNGTLDSLKTIGALEEVLGVELIEK